MITIDKQKASERLKEFMKIYNLKQADIIEKTGISSSCLSSYVNGTRQPKSDKIGLIADAYGVNISWLMGFDTSMIEKNVDIPNKQNISEHIEIINMYDKLNAEQKKLVYDMMKNMIK